MRFELFFSIEGILIQNAKYFRCFHSDSSPFWILNFTLSCVPSFNSRRRKLNGLPIQRMTKAIKLLNLSDFSCSKELFVTFGVNETNELCAVS